MRPELHRRDIYPTRLTRIRLTNFRNYASLDLLVAPNPVVLTGANGSGKTNLLEAISFLSPGRGLRRAPYPDIALQPEKGGDGSWALSCSLETRSGSHDIGTGLAQGQQSSGRLLKIDREVQKKSDCLLDYVRVLWLTPAMDGLFTGPAGDRRRFLDRLVLAIDPSHGQRVNAFDKMIRSRNRILEEAPGNSAWLDATEVQIAEHGVAIAAARRELVSLVYGDLISLCETRPFPSAKLALDGALDQLLEDQSATDVEDHYMSLLRDGRARDQRAGRTLDGPHRSDLLVTHQAKDMPARLCSTGEQKALLIGLVLAHATLVARLSGMAPLVLLDEITAHLDLERRAALFDVLHALNCQAWMTGTDKDYFHDLGERASYFSVDDGTITAQ